MGNRISNRREAGAARSVFINSLRPPRPSAGPSRVPGPSGGCVCPVQGEAVTPRGARAGGIALLSPGPWRHLGCGSGSAGRGRLDSRHKRSPAELWTCFARRFGSDLGRLASSVLENAVHGVREVREILPGTTAAHAGRPIAGALGVNGVGPDLESDGPVFRFPERHRLAAWPLGTCLACWNPNFLN